MTAREISPRLGRGLAALLGDATDQAAETAVQPIAIDLLEPGPFQPRGAIEPVALAELVESVRARGILQPILVRPHPGLVGRFQIIAGERRWRAAQAAGLHEVPSLVRPLSDADSLAAALVENLQRQDLNAIEEAEGYRRLIEEFAMTQDHLGSAVGKSRSHVANTLRLLRLPAPVQTELSNGAITAGHARALLAHPDPARAALEVISRGLNVRQTEELVAREVRHPDGTSRTADTKPDRKDPETLALERTLSEELGLRVEIQASGRGGSVRIRFQSLDQLDGLITLLSPGTLGQR